MTKAEVQSNIRYNENLVAQYRNNISQLQSQINELGGPFIIKAQSN